MLACENLTLVLRLKEQFEEFEEQQHGMSVCLWVLGACWLFTLTVLKFMLTLHSVCIRRVRNRSFSPNTVVACFLMDSVVGMVHVNDQVPVVVVG